MIILSEKYKLHEDLKNDRQINLGNLSPLRIKLMNGFLTFSCAFFRPKNDIKKKKRNLLVMTVKKLPLPFMSQKISLKMPLALFIIMVVASFCMKQTLIIEMLAIMQEMQIAKLFSYIIVLLQNIHFPCLQKMPTVLYYGFMNMQTN